MKKSTAPMVIRKIPRHPGVTDGEACLAQIRRERIGMTVIVLLFGVLMFAVWYMGGD